MAVAESTQSLKQLGQDAIHQKALDAARQIELYLEAHPQLATLSPQELQANQTLVSIAVQPVGQTGYTAVYDSAGIDYFHTNPKIVGTDLHALSTSLPSFWAILQASLDGQASSGYYEWQDADGSIRDKYMSCVPVGNTNLRVAATTYIDEFYQPIRETEAKITNIFQNVHVFTLVSIALVGLGAIALAVWLAWGLSRPILSITDAAAAVEAGEFETISLKDTAKRSDELGRLATVFQRMARQVYAREQHLKQQVKQLRIEIDVAKQQRQVREIVETDFFQYLQAKAREMRLKSQRLDSNTQDTSTEKNSD
jgi:methyl-accepting chemotaxis protein